MESINDGNTPKTKPKGMKRPTSSKQKIDQTTSKKPSAHQKRKKKTTNPTTKSIEENKPKEKSTENNSQKNLRPKSAPERTTKRVVMVVKKKSHADDPAANKNDTTKNKSKKKDKGNDQKDQIKSDNKENRSPSKKKTNRDRDNHGYENYLPHTIVLKRLEEGTLLQGKLHINAQYRIDGYVRIDGLGSDILVRGMVDRNRAMDGDLVAVEVFPTTQWKTSNKQAGGDEEEDQEEEVLGSYSKFKNTSNKSAEKNHKDKKIVHQLWLPNISYDPSTPKNTPGKCPNSAGMGQSSPTGDECSGLSMIQALIHENPQLRPTGKVVHVLAAGNQHGFIGSLQPKTQVKGEGAVLSEKDDYAFFNAQDLRIPRRIRIPRNQLPDAFIKNPLQYSSKMLCFCRIKRWSTKHQSPMGEFVRTLGEFDGISTGISSILSQNGLEAHAKEFDDKILQELQQQYGLAGDKWTISEEEISNRRDFRSTDYAIFSIDPTNARDLDDSLHINRLGNDRYEIGVHIADVAHFVRPGSELDEEAKRRATSVYFVNQVLAMLPRMLCENLCSLQPQVDRLAFSVVWQMKSDGTLVEDVAPWFGKSIIRSCCKLDYGIAQRMIDGSIYDTTTNSGEYVEWEQERRPRQVEDGFTCEQIIERVQDLWKIASARRQKRFDTGALALQNVKLYFQLDEAGNPCSFMNYHLRDSNRLVEEYMLLANYLVAQQLLKAHGPLAFLRCHPAPDDRLLENTLNTVIEQDGNMGLDGSDSKRLHHSLQKLRHSRGEEVYSVIQALLTKPMRPAEYMVAGTSSSASEWRHYALNIPYYTHFTSPIRRYADVIVHRLLEESLTTPDSEDGKEEEEAEEDPRVQEFSSIASNCNEKKMTAKKASDECDQVFLTVYVKDNPMDVTGIVISAGQKSFTLYILELGFEKRLFLSQLKLQSKWDEDKASLSIRLVQKTVDLVSNGIETLSIQEGNDTKKKSKQQITKWIDLFFMKKLCFRLSATDKMPLDLVFTLVDEV